MVTDRPTVAEMADPVRWANFLRRAGFETDTEEDPEVLAMDFSYLEEEDPVIHTEEEFMDPRVINVVHQLRQVQKEDLYAEKTIKLMEEAMDLFMATPSKEEASVLSKAREEVTSRQVDDVLDDCLNSIGRTMMEERRKNADLGKGGIDSVFAVLKEKD